MLFHKPFRSFGEPWRELAALQRELARNGVWGASPETRDVPLVNLFANEHQVVLTAEIPGLDLKDLDVTVTGDSVTLSGQRAEETVAAGQSFHRRERPAGKFSRTLQLPFSVDPAQTNAVYEAGVLKVTLARPEEQRPRKVSVKPVSR